MKSARSDLIAERSDLAFFVPRAEVSQITQSGGTTLPINSAMEVWLNTSRSVLRMCSQTLAKARASSPCASFAGSPGPSIAERTSPSEILSGDRARR